MKHSVPAKFKAFRKPDPYGYSEALVYVNGRPLPLRLDLRNHSPDGHEWGYGGSGPAQLALSILAFVCGDEIAQAHYQDFKFKVIAHQPHDGWEMTSEEVEDWLALHMFNLEQGKYR